MIITLKGANFSASNIGALDSWFITRDFGSGVNYSGPTSVKKNAALNATITISSGYELNGSVSVTMGDSSVTSGITTSGNTITISIASVTGAVTIKVPTKSTSGGSDEPDTPVTPDTPSGETIWYINSLEEMQQLNKDITKGTQCTPQKTTAWGYDEFNSKLFGKTINTIEVYAQLAGVFHFGIYNKDSKNFTTVQEVTISEINKPIKYYVDNMTLSNNDIFVWNIPINYNTEAALYYIGQVSGHDYSGLSLCTWYYATNGGLEDFNYQLALSINIGYTA